MGVGVTQGRFTFQTLTPKGYYRNFWVGMYRWDPGTLNLYQSYNLGQNKMEQQTLIPPPPKSRMKPREGQKRAIFPSLIWGGGVGSRFSMYFVQDCSFKASLAEFCYPI